MLFLEITSPVTMCRAQSGSFAVAGAGIVRQIRDLRSQPSGEKLEMRPEVTTSMDRQH